MSIDSVKIISTYGGALNIDVGFKRTWLGRTGIVANDHLPNFRLGGLAAMVVPVDTLDDIRAILSEVSESQGQLSMVDKAEQLPQVWAMGQVPLLFCACYKTVEEDLSRVAFLRRLGVRMFTLSSNRRNVLCDGCGERNPSGLSHLGVAVAKELERNGILPDVSHLSDESFWDLLQNTTGPIVASHSNTRALCPSVRNLSDEQIKAIAERGGFVATSTYPTLVAAQNPSVEIVADHLMHVGKLVGYEYAAIGTDLTGFLGNLFDATIHRIDPSGALYSQDAGSMPTAGISAYEDVNNLLSVLSRRGLTDAQLELVAYKNFLRVLGSVE